MLSKFFIDRPIFATVLSVVITLAGGIAMFSLPVAQYPRITPPSVSVSITYPGASAQVVADTVAAPIEQQVTGVPGMLYMSSQMGNDGTYTLSVTFDVSVDLNTALVMVQNRVTLAMPLLPTPVQNQGITIRKRTPDILCMVNFMAARIIKTKDGRTMTGQRARDDENSVTLRYPNGKEERILKKDIQSNEPVFDDVFMSNYALINVRDELLRVDGVSDINIMGERDYSIRAWLDPQKLASRNMTAIDVAQAVGNQNLAAAPGQVGQPPMGKPPAFTWPLDTLGRLSQPEQFGDIIVKVGWSQLMKSAQGTVTPSPGGDAGAPNTDYSQGAQPQIGGMSNGGLSGTPTDSGSATTDSSTSSNGGAPSGGGTTGGGANTGGGGTTGGGASLTGGMPGAATLSSMGKSGGASATRRTPVTTSSKSGATKGMQAPQGTSISIVRLKDVARVEMGALNYNMSCTFDGGPSVGLTVYQLPGTNALDVADRVRAKMEELKKRFPDGIEYTIAYDITPFIRESISEVFHTLRDAILLVAFVVLLFLQDWRAMILPMIDVPVSLIGTFAVMAAMGYSLNNISLFGLVLAIGIVVDDAIVVLENIERQMAKGFETRTATIKAMEEISGPILAITLVLCAVFVPCAFISGITGRFFRQFAVTISASTVISAINALTMTPSRALVIFKTKEGHNGGHEHQREALPWWIFGALGALTLSLGPHYLAKPLGLPESTETEGGLPMPAWQAWGIRAIYFTPGLLVGLLLGWYFIRPVNAVLGVLFRGFNRVFDGLTAMYGWTIGMALRLSVIVLIAYAALLFLTFYIFKSAPTGFVPQQDMGRLIVSVQLPDSASLARTQEAVAKVEAIIRKTPGVAHSIGLCGISFVEQANGSNFGSLFVILDPFEKRQKPHLKDEAIMARLRKEWAKEVKDARVVVFGSSPIPGLSVAGGFKVIVEDRGGLGLPTLQDQTDRLVRKLQGDSFKFTAKFFTASSSAGVPDTVLNKLKPMKDEQFNQQQLKQKLAKTLDKAELQSYETVLVNNARQTEIGLAGVNTQFRSNTPQLFMDIDRTKVASLGVSLNDVNQTLQIYLGSLYVNSFNEFGRHWQVTLQADKQFRSTVEEINLLQVRNNKGQMVPLGTLVNVKEITGPIFVKRYNLYTAAPITGALLPGVSSGDVIEAVDEIADRSLPRSMKTEWTELMFMQIKEGNTTGIVFALAVVCVFLALSALYESWTLPLAVILVVPLCVLCSLIGVLYTNNLLGMLSQTGLVGGNTPGRRQFVDPSVNIFVQIGLVVLVGLACKNAILVVEFAKELHTSGGRSVFEATLEASRLRLRPILMTSFAFILGVVPLCVASGAGAEMRKSLGMAVFSGMLGVTLFGIFLTPVFFYVIQGIGETRLFSGNVFQWILSCCLGSGLGGGTGYLLAQLGVFRMPWAVILGACAGVLAVAAVRGVHRTLLSRS